MQQISNFWNDPGVAGGGQQGESLLHGESLQGESLQGEGLQGVGLQEEEPAPGSR